MRSRPKPINQSGFLSLEVIIVLALLAVLAAAYVFNLNTSNSKGTTLHTVAQEYADAMIRAKADMACYPTRMDALFDSTKVTSSSCGLDLTPQWKGPYVQIAPVDTAGAILLNSIAPGATLTLASTTDATGTHWQIQVSGIPKEILDRARANCNGGPALTGRCTGTAGTGATGTFTLEFDRT
jgi:type II secretory pathway pseudopilin PulG